MLTSLVSRQSFVSASKAGLSCRTFTLLVQAHAVESSMITSPALQEAFNAWVGFTATKRLGGAVVRNRAKRRMRAVAREHAATISQSGMYFVFVAREGLLKADHARLCDDMAYAIRRLTREFRAKSAPAKVATS